MKLTVQLIMMLLLISACDKEKEGLLPFLKVNAEIENKGSSKASFKEEDEIGVFLLNADNSDYVKSIANIKATLFSGEWILDKKVRLNKNAGAVYAYFPFNPLVENVTEIPVNIENQVDYLEGKALQNVSENNVEGTVIMNHAFSLLKFQIKKDGYNGEGLISAVELVRVPRKGVLNILNGEIHIQEYGNALFKCNHLLKDGLPLTIGIISFPFVSSDKNVLIRFTIDGSVYFYQFANPIWEQGKEITYTLSINEETKTLFSVGETTILGWGAGGSYEGNLQPAK